MEVQRSEGSFQEDFELDTGRILSLAAHTAAEAEPSPVNQSKRPKPSERGNLDWPMRRSGGATQTPPCRNSGGFDEFRFSAEKRGDGTHHDAGQFCSQVQMVMRIGHMMDTCSELHVMHSQARRSLLPLKAVHGALQFVQSCQCELVARWELLVKCKATTCGAGTPQLQNRPAAVGSQAAAASMHPQQHLHHAQPLQDSNGQDPAWQPQWQQRGPQPQYVHRCSVHVNASIFAQQQEHTLLCPHCLLVLAVAKSISHETFLAIPEFCGNHSVCMCCEYIQYEPQQKIQHHVMPVITPFILCHVSNTAMQHLVLNQIQNAGNVLRLCEAKKIRR